MLSSLFDFFDNIIIFDLETTGFSFKNDEIIEFAAVRVTDDAESVSIDCELDEFISLSAGRRLPGRL